MNPLCLVALGVLDKLLQIYLLDIEGMTVEQRTARSNRLATEQERIWRLLEKFHGDA